MGGDLNTFAACKPGALFPQLADKNNKNNNNPTEPTKVNLDLTALSDAPSGESAPSMTAAVAWDGDLDEMRRSLGKLCADVRNLEEIACNYMKKLESIRSASVYLSAKTASVRLAHFSRRIVHRNNLVGRGIVFNTAVPTNAGAGGSGAAAAFPSKGGPKVGGGAAAGHGTSSAAAKAGEDAAESRPTRFKKTSQSEDGRGDSPAQSGGGGGGGGQFGSKKRKNSLGEADLIDSDELASINHSGISGSSSRAISSDALIETVDLTNSQGTTDDGASKNNKAKKASEPVAKKRKRT
jgi:hypothetical protein